MKAIDDLAVAGQRVLVRDDLNVPLDGGRVADDGRIRAALPTLVALLDRNAAVIVCAHLGRPGGKPDPKYSLAPVAACLGELLGREVRFAADTVGPAARAAVSALQPGGLVMLENLRFNEGETSKDDTLRGRFADQLAALADLYVADGFGAVHRKHASVYDVALRLPHAAGYLVQAEVAALNRLTADIRRPYVVVLGGAEGHGQVRHHRQPDHHGRHHSRRRRHGLPLSRRPRATRSARPCWTPAWSTPRRVAWSRPHRAGTQIVLPPDVIVAARTDR